MISRRLSLAAMALALAPRLAAAQPGFPTKPIRYVLHVSPGGATDIMARQLANELQRSLRQPIVVENRAGGRGAAQLADLRASKPDGYTVGSVTSTHIASFHQTLRQYSVGSLDWIVKLAAEPYLIVAQKDGPIGTLGDLVGTIKAAPGRTVMAGFVRGSGSHIAWEMLLRAAELPSNAANWVPYDSVGDGVTAVLGGHGVATVAYLDLVKEHVEAGNLRVIGVMTGQRLPEFPDAPTFREQGLNVTNDWQQWRGIIGPRGIPDDIKRRIAEAVQQALSTPALQQYLRQASLKEDFLGPQEFTAFAADQDRITVEWLQRLGFLRT